MMTTSTITTMAGVGTFPAAEGDMMSDDTNGAAVTVVKAAGGSAIAVFIAELVIVLAMVLKVVETRVTDKSLVRMTGIVITEGSNRV